MKTILALATAAVALSLTSATAFAADHDRFDRNHNGGPAFNHQDDNQHFNLPNRNVPPAQNQRHDWQPNTNQNWSQNNWRNNDWRNNKGFRFNLFAPRRFSAGAYHSPRGFQYRRYSYGDRLPYTYLSSNYWLTNALLYGLFSPPSGLVWVRYGDDALLVDRYTGEIVQVRYNVFY